MLHSDDQQLQQFQALKHGEQTFSIKISQFQNHTKIENCWKIDGKLIENGKA